MNKFVSSRERELLVRAHSSRRLVAAALAFSVLLALLPQVSALSAAPAIADEPLVWPATEVYVDPSYENVLGIQVMSTTPTIYLWSEDVEEPANGYPDYSYEIEIADGSEAPTTIASAHVPGYRSGDFTDAEWEVPEGVLALDETYALKYRLQAGGSLSDWSSWSTLHIVGLAAAPELLGPADGSIGEVNPALTARIADFDAGAEAYVYFVVESNWQNGAPTEVASSWVQVDQDGLASYTPNLTSRFTEGRFRWRAQSEGPGQSEWSSFREFSIGKKPKAVTGIQLIQDRRALVVKWLQPMYSVNFPVQQFMVTLEPGGYSTTVSGSVFSARFDDLQYQDYAATVTATNALGSGPVAGIVGTVSPTTPMPPANLVVDVEGTDAEATWDAPEEDGGSPVDQYHARLIGCSTPAPAEFTLVEHFTSFSNLIAGCQYRFQVLAENSIGRSPNAMEYFTAYSEPSAPTDVEVRLGDEFLDVFWNEPLSTNGSDIRQYRVTATPGGAAVVVTAGYGRQGIQFDGLTNGTQYTFAVQAINEAGAGPAETTPPLAPMDDSEDVDQDGLPDVIEARVGSSPLIIDSDNDGLTDAQEVMLLAAFNAPTSADTDADGIGDADEDPDGDGITNSLEVQAGTNPAAPDSDGDRLDDPTELSGQTDPMNSDSDGDGLDDGFEMESGLNPVAVDSDADTIPDAADSLTRVVQLHATEPPYDIGDEIPAELAIASASATLSGAGGEISRYAVAEMPSSAVVGAITAVASIVGSYDGTEDASGSMATAMLGPAVPNSFSAATATELKLGYSALVATERLANLAPVWWNESTSVWEFADNDVSISTATRTISILSPELGLLYAVVDLGLWEANLRECDLSANGSAPLDVEVILDETKNVADADTTGERFDAVRSVIGSLGLEDRVAVRAASILGVYARGGANYYQVIPDSPIEDVAPRLSLGSSPVERALDRIDRIEEAAIASNGFGVADLFDGTEERFAEQAFGDSLFSAEHLPDLTGNPYVEDADIFDCRQKAIVFVTDGKFKPAASFDDSDYADSFPTDYVPLIERDTPVHILDVGTGSSSDSGWLIDWATASGGTYSYVPTAADLDAWISDVTPPMDPVTDATTDTDGDGVPDWVELHGVSSTMTSKGNQQPNRYYSDPDDADTDDDGLTDGEEIGTRFVALTAGVDWTSSRPITSYAVISHPGMSDGDFDGLRDFEEIEVGMNALNQDPDGDGLLDGDEEENGTFAQMYDTDLDGFSDGFEVYNEGDGYDPTEHTETISPTQWLQDFALGFFCGEVDYCTREAMAWLAGNIVSGLLVFGDVRDGIAAAFRGDAVGVTFCAVGFIPGMGDAIGSAAKVVKYTVKATKPASQAAALKQLRHFTDSPTDYVEQLRRIDPAFVSSLTSRNLSDETISRLVDANGINRIKAMLSSGSLKTYPYSIHPTFMPSGKAGEVFMQNLVGIPGYKQTRVLVPGSKLRYPDGITITTVDGIRTITHFESKVGYAASAFTRFQVLKDIRLLDHSMADEVEWHFFASEITGKIGPSAGILKLLTENGIAVVLHFPS